MKNKNVIYIECLNSFLDVLSGWYPSWFRRFIYRVLYFCGYVKVEKNRIKLYCMAQDVINVRMINNLKKKLFLQEAKNIVLSDILLKNSVMLEFLKGLNYNVLDGKWLYRFLCYEVVSKIAYVKNEKLCDMEISILAEGNSDIVIENIKLLAKECKVLNVITDNLHKFESVEKSLFDECGNIINVSTNKAKACKYSDIILNFDFSVEQLRKCKFRRDVILVQFTKEKFENRNGVTIVFYKLNFPSKYVSIFNEYKNYSEEIVYESLLYYNISFDNLRRILLKDNISIKLFLGVNGKISFKEIRNET